MDTEVIVKQENCVKYESSTDMLQADASDHHINLAEIKQEKGIESQQLRQQHPLKDDGDDINLEIKQPIAEALNIKTEVLDSVTLEEYCVNDFATANDIQIDVEQKCFECRVCKYRSLTKGHLTEHMNTHTGVKPFECGICIYKCSRKRSLRYHMRVHTGEKPFKCGVCKQKFADSRHMEIHAGPFECETCKNKYSSKDGLRIHMKVHTGKQPHECITCKAKFTKQSHWKQHMRTHTGEKLYGCEICNNKYSFPSRLRRHMTIHTGDKPFECTVCKTKCRTKSRLNEHMRTHTGEKPYKCEICNKKYSDSSSLRRHMTIHTGEKPFGCEICVKRFSTKNKLTNHMVSHTKEKPFECDICKNRFSKKAYLASHTKRDHTEKKSVKLRKSNGDHGKMDLLIKKEINVESEIFDRLSANSSENTSDGISKQEPSGPKLQLQDNLPTSYKYISEGNVIRANIGNKSEVEKWLLSLQDITKETWRISKTFKISPKYPRVFFKRLYHCHFNSRRRKVTKNIREKKSKNIGCPAKLLITIRNFKTQNDFPCTIQFRENHNHRINVVQTDRENLVTHIKRCMEKTLVKLRKCNGDHGKMDSLNKGEINVESEISSNLSANSSENASGGNSILIDVKQEPLSPEAQSEVKDESAVMGIKSEAFCEEVTFKDELEDNIEVKPLIPEEVIIKNE